MRRVVEDERGQAVPLAAALVAMAAMLVLGIGVMAHDVGDAGRARSAADAAALAGVEGDRAASASVAGANGGVLVSWSRVGRDVIVRVRVGAVTASARATGGEVAGRGAECHRLVGPLTYTCAS
jgi:hypothetical protein